MSSKKAKLTAANEAATKKEDEINLLRQRPSGS